MLGERWMEIALVEMERSEVRQMWMELDGRWFGCVQKCTYIIITYLYEKMDGVRESIETDFGI